MEQQQKPDLSQLRVGGPVIYVDPVAQQIEALVTAVWGDPTVQTPCINVVFVNPDDTMHDSYGRQITRQTSVTHRSLTVAHGNYYMMPGDSPNPIVGATQR